MVRVSAGLSSTRVDDLTLPSSQDLTPPHSPTALVTLSKAHLWKPPGLSLFFWQKLRITKTEELFRSIQPLTDKDSPASQKYLFEALKSSKPKQVLPLGGCEDSEMNGCQRMSYFTTSAGMARSNPDDTKSRDAPAGGVRCTVVPKGPPDSTPIPSSCRVSHPEVDTWGRTE